MSTGDAPAPSAQPAPAFDTVSIRLVSRSSGSGAKNVPDTPLSVPATLARYGLSEIVNHLLSQDPPRPYDFLVNGEFLRSSLGKFITTRDIAPDTVLVLEYVEAMPPPSEDPALPHPDWIAAVDTCGHPRYIVTGGYDGVVRVFDSAQWAGEKTAPLAVGKGHNSAIKAVKTVVFAAGSDAEDDEAKAAAASTFVISASKDRTLRIYRVGTGVAELAVTCKGHSDAVESLAVMPKSGPHKKFCSGGHDKRIYLWDWPDLAALAQEERTKTRRVDGTNKVASHVPEYSSSQYLDGHTQVVSALCWPFSSAIYSGSWDHNIRMWDVPTAVSVHSWNTAAVVSGLSFSTERNLLASTHHDRLIRVWDPRMKEREALKFSLKSHQGWVTSCRWLSEALHTQQRAGRELSGSSSGGEEGWLGSPNAANLLASTSYDHTVKVWDIRSSVPLHTIAAHTDKVMCVDWQVTSSPSSSSSSKGGQVKAGVRLYTGGADCKLRRHELPVAMSS